MRATIFSLLTGAVALVRSEPVGSLENDETESTTFNSITVPPLFELTPSNWAEEVNKTRWLVVKHYR